MPVEEILKELNSVKNRALRSIGMVRSRKSLDAARSRYLGRKGHVSELVRQVAALPDDARPLAGQTANSVKTAIQQAIERKEEELKQLEQELRILDEALDVTLPGADVRRGRLHPITQVGARVLRVFQSMGFSVVRGPEMGTTDGDLETLDLPRFLPARDLQNTFFVEENVALCAQASPVPAPYMLAHDPPVAVLSPACVYRRDPDQPDFPMRRRIHGLMVDETVCFADLKGILEIFVREIFGPDTRLRLRPAYFPYTEPSCRADIQTPRTAGEEDEDKDWIGIVGAGMVHPVVFESLGLDPQRYSGIAFELDIEQIGQILYGLSEPRAFYDNELRFLEQF